VADPTFLRCWICGSSILLRNFNRSHRDWKSLPQLSFCCSLPISCSIRNHLPPYSKSFNLKSAIRNLQLISLSSDQLPCRKPAVDHEFDSSNIRRRGRCQKQQRASQIGGFRHSAKRDARTKLLPEFRVLIARYPPR